MQINSFYLFFLYVLFVIFTGLMLCSLKDFFCFIKAMPKAGGYLLFAVLSLSFILRLCFIKHEVFFDEPIYLNVAQNMFYHHQPGGTLQGTKLLADIIVPYNRPGGHSFLIQLLYLIFGESDNSALLLNPFLGTISVGVFFLFVYGVLNSVVVAFIGGMLLCFFPIHMVYCGSVSSEVPSLFFSLTAFLSLVLYARTRKTGLLYLALSSAICGVYVRPENLLLFPFLILVLLYFVKEGMLPRTKIGDLCFFLIVLLLPLLVTLPSMRIEEFAANNGQFWSFRIFCQHLAINGKYLVDGYYLPQIYILLSILGGYFLLRCYGMLFAVALLYFLASFISYSGHYAGIFAYSNRYFFFGIIPVCLFASAGFNFISVLCGRKWGGVISGFLLLILIAASFTSTQRLYGRLFKHTDGREYAALLQAGRKLSDKDYVVTMEPYIVVSAWNKKAIDAREFFRRKFPYNRVFLVKNHNWLESDYIMYERMLRQEYDFKIIYQKQFSPDFRTFIAELTKKQ